ncbi:hypothetical protein DACRYDRAFT_112081 [Dacryopinax primogenitus]|uniref:Uncharacterized protein n=1 Tax=Dacryopinax primogenitus (strain DJM 731) TaxID=1858805 RepID=M5FV05_DACPD|nr:uncharacterized protein DACRYDRAFT_112081 [Dacryopinax primogenitus]EJT97121.1 hypothetical protein DACRYDRAFT_112081 [Dacryopinax primogenitus]
MHLCKLAALLAAGVIVTVSAIPIHNVVPALSLRDLEPADRNELSARWLDPDLDARTLRFLRDIRKCSFKLRQKVKYNGPPTTYKKQKKPSTTGQEEEEGQVGVIVKVPDPGSDIYKVSFRQMERDKRGIGHAQYRQDYIKCTDLRSA